MYNEPRFKISTGKDTTRAIVRPVYAPVITINPVQEDFLFMPTLLTGNLILNVSVSDAYCFPGDTLKVLLKSDHENRAVTLADGFFKKQSFVINGNDSRYLQFIFDGYSWILN